MNKPRLSLSPSSASRWTTCTASPRLIAENKHLIVEEDKAFTKEGEAAHEMAKNAFADTNVLLAAEDTDMAIHVGEYILFCQKLAQGFEEVQVEQKVPIWYFPERHGYIDFYALNEEQDTLVIVDLKYGEGIPVTAAGNLQLAIYGQSLVEKLNLSGDCLVKLHIHQPRSPKEKTTKWHLTVSELNAFCEREIMPSVDLIQNDLVDYAPSDTACQFCQAKDFCKARAGYLLGDDNFAAFISTTVEDTKDSEEYLLTGVAPKAQEGTTFLPSLSTMSPGEIAQALRNRSKVIAWYNGLQEYALTAVRAGREDLVEGFGLVQGGLGDRKWKDEVAAERLLARELSAPERRIMKLVSPAQAEKLLKGKELSARFKNRFETLIVRERRADTMMDKNDPTYAVRNLEQSELSLFEDISGEDENDLLA